jgi:hypothetical protein
LPGSTRPSQRSAPKARRSCEPSLCRPEAAAAPSGRPTGLVHEHRRGSRDEQSRRGRRPRPCGRRRHGPDLRHRGDRARRTRTRPGPDGPLPPNRMAPRPIGPKPPPRPWTEAGPFRRCWLTSTPSTAGTSTASSKRSRPTPSSPT